MVNRPVVIGLGEILWDCFADSRRPGGAPANVAFQANQLGCEGNVCSRIGSDPLGDELVTFLEQEGISTRYLQRDTQHPTGTVTVKMDEGNHPTYTIHENVAWDAIEPSADWLQFMQAASAVCFGSLAQRTSMGHAAIQECLAATSQHCLKVYDVNLRQDYYSCAVIEDSLHAADIIKLNHEEVDAIVETLDVPQSDERAFAGLIREQYNVGLLCHHTWSKRLCVDFR